MDECDNFNSGLANAEASAVDEMMDKFTYS
jgi:hypothetical protein